MGRKKADAADAGEQTETAAVKPSEVQVLIGEKQLKTLLTRCRSTSAEVDSLVGDLREKIGHSVEKQNLHKGAFALLRKFDKMDESKAKDLLDTFLAYMDISGVQKRIDAVQTLNFAPPEAEDDAETQQPSSRRRQRFPAASEEQREAAE